MRRTHFVRERNKLEAKARELKAEIDAVMKRINALDVVWNEIFSKESGQPLPPTPERETGPEIEVADIHAKIPIETTTSPAAPPTNGAMGKLIDALAVGHVGDFGVKQIEAKILDEYPNAVLDRTTIAGRLKRLVDHGRLQLIEQGKGRKASVFRSSAA